MSLGLDKLDRRNSLGSLVDGGVSDAKSNNSPLKSVIFHQDHLNLDKESNVGKHSDHFERMDTSNT